MAKRKHSNRLKPDVSDSWVVPSDGDEASLVTSTSSASQDPPITQNRSSTRSKSAEPESPRLLPSRKTSAVDTQPELIMPSIHEDLVEFKSAARQPYRSQQERVTEHRRQLSNGKKTMTLERYKAAEMRHSNKSLIWLAFEGMADVLGRTLRILKTPLSYLLASYLLLGTLVFTRNLLFTSVQSALTPLCRIPGVSLLGLPLCDHPGGINYKNGRAPVVEFDQLMTVQSKFEDILEQSAGSTSLPVDMKQTQTSVRDLRSRIRHSNLKSKTILLFEIDGFIDTARVATLDLQKFNTHVGSAVDRILSTTRWTERRLKEIEDEKQSRGAVVSFISDRLFVPFQPLRFSEDALTDQYIKHTGIVKEKIGDLLSEGLRLLALLESLEDRLEAMHEISTQEWHDAKASREEILAQLWTKLGGNATKLGKFDSQIALVNQMNMYRRTAFAHVSGTILKLQAIDAELEELKERVGSVEVLRDRKDIPLNVHIENIQLGVQRLEAERESTKKRGEDLFRSHLGDRMASERLIGD